MKHSKVSATCFSNTNVNDGHTTVTRLLLQWNVSKFETDLEGDLLPVVNRSGGVNTWLNPVNISPNICQLFEVEKEMKLKRKVAFFQPMKLGL
jgi:hypothetical protein